MFSNMCKPTLILLHSILQCLCIKLLLCINILKYPANTKHLYNIYTMLDHNVCCRKNNYSCDNIYSFTSTNKCKYDKKCNDF